MVIRKKVARKKTVKKKTSKGRVVKHSKAARKHGRLPGKKGKASKVRKFKRLSKSRR